MQLVPFISSCKRLNVTTIYLLWLRLTSDFNKISLTRFDSRNSVVFVTDKTVNRIPNEILSTPMGEGAVGVFISMDPEFSSVVGFLLCTGIGGMLPRIECYLVTRGASLLLTSGHPSHSLSPPQPAFL